MLKSGDLPIIVSICSTGDRGVIIACLINLLMFSLRGFIFLHNF